MTRDRVTELLEASNREVERRRAAEAALRAIHAARLTHDGSDHGYGWNITKLNRAMNAALSLIGRMVPPQPSFSEKPMIQDRTEIDGRQHRMSAATLSHYPGPECRFVAVEPGGCAPPVLIDPPATAQRKPVLIALTANAMGAGKSVVANHLVERHGFTLVKFAGGLKAMTRALLAEIGYPDIVIDGYVEGELKETVIPELGITCRRLMQLAGSEFGRDLIHPDIWARLTAARCARLLEAGTDVVIDDMRYPNELGAVRPLGAYVVRIVRPGIADTTGHSSEGGLADAPVNETLVNGSTVAALQRLADDAVVCCRTIN